LILASICLQKWWTTECLDIVATAVVAVAGADVA
jgi:hypothetical protein